MNHHNWYHYETSPYLQWGLFSDGRADNIEDENTWDVEETLKNYFWLFSWSQFTILNNIIKFLLKSSTDFVFLCTKGSWSPHGYLTKLERVTLANQYFLSLFDFPNKKNVPKLLMSRELQCFTEQTFTWVGYLDIIDRDLIDSYLLVSIHYSREQYFIFSELPTHYS